MAVSTTVINTVARRLRDNANLAYPRAVLIRFVDHAQRIVSAHTKSVVPTIAISTSLLHTFSPLYRNVTLLGQEISSFISVRLDGKTLDRITPFHALVHQDPRWFGTQGSRIVSWGTVGKDFLVLYPIMNPIPTGSTLEFDVVPTIPSVILDNGTADIVLPDELVPTLQDLVEAIGCLMGRRYSEASDPIARFEQSISTIGRAYRQQDIFGKV